MNTAAFEGRVRAGGADASKYETPAVGRYQDLQREDEGQTRFDYQLGRARLFAKGASVQHVGHTLPVSARQENFVESAPSIAASCATCHGCLPCGTDSDVFCSTCNVNALQPAGAGLGSLFE